MPLRGQGLKLGLEFWAIHGLFETSNKTRDGNRELERAVFGYSSTWDSI